ncbi:MAG: pseudouridine-5'-phosphate glycosidase [Candidatus Nanopelagicales bacterium]
MKISPKVQEALNNKKAVVALESTIIAHGLPRPDNFKIAQKIEQVVIDQGATPATIAILNGEICVGLDESQLTQVATDTNILKLGIRDIAHCVTRKQSGATTVASTAWIAHLSGITTFATGGLGGVHKGSIETFDESGDITALAQIPIVVVSSGIKSILDVAATLERLETWHVPVYGWKTNDFPGFWIKDSGFDIGEKVESVEEVAEIYKFRKTNDFSESVLIANPINKEDEFDPQLEQKILEKGMKLAKEQNISGKAVTPFLLGLMHSESQGKSLKANVALVKSNAQLAAQIAVAISKK